MKLKICDLLRSICLCASVVFLSSCAHNNLKEPPKEEAVKKATPSSPQRKSFQVEDDETTKKKLIEKLEKQLTDLEIQNAILLKALNERKKIVHKLPKGEVVQQFPEFEELIFDQAKTAYKEKDEERLQEAVRILRSNQPSSGKLEVMFFWLAKLQEESGNTSQSLVTYDEFIKMFPDSKYVPQAKFLKGKLYEKLNLTAQAMKIYNEIRTLHPHSREKHFADLKLKENSSDQSKVKRKK